MKFYLKGKDPYDTHDVFLDGAEKLDVKAYFFFMAGCHNRFDPRDQLSHPKVKFLLEKIKKRGHHIGFHPSYKSYDDAQIFSQEKKRLEKITDQKVETGRQHYLRFENPTTWNLWENENNETSKNDFPTVVLTGCSDRMWFGLSSGWTSRGACPNLDLLAWLGNVSADVPRPGLYS